MLVLSRKEGQAIKIDGNISVTVLSVQGNRVRLGIQAPHDVTVHRQEVWFELASHEHPELELANHHA
jgi:carbon storage regulator